MWTESDLRKLREIRRNLKQSVNSVPEPRKPLPTICTISGERIGSRLIRRRKEAGL